jgi:hypothetical protein
MWSAGFDSGRQLLQVSYSGKVARDEAEACNRRLSELLGNVEPGFTLLTDLSQLDEMDLACRPAIDKMMDTLSDRGVRKVIRVVPAPEKDIGFGIMSLFHYGPEVRVVTCKNMDEARQVVGGGVRPASS